MRNAKRNEAAMVLNAQYTTSSKLMVEVEHSGCSSVEVAGVLEQVEGDQVAAHD